MNNPKSIDAILLAYGKWVANTHQIETQPHELNYTQAKTELKSLIMSSIPKEKKVDRNLVGQIMRLNGYNESLKDTKQAVERLFK